MLRYAMLRQTWIILLCLILVFNFAGCKGKPKDISLTKEFDMEIVVEPSQRLASEPIPPTASVPPDVSKRSETRPQEKSDINKLIQRALKKANFYKGAIDGIVGPKTKKAIRDFQRAKGLKVDGKVGPRTWSELKKYL